MGYYSYTKQTQKFEIFQRRLKILMVNKTVSKELDNSAIQFSKIKFSKLADKNQNDEEQEKMMRELKNSQIQNDISDRIINRELDFQEKSISLRYFKKIERKENQTAFKKNRFVYQQI